MLNFVEFLSSSDEDDKVECYENCSTDVEINDTTILDETNVPQTTKIQPSAHKQNSQQKKKETVAMIKQLKTHIVSLEKEKQSQLYSKRSKSKEIVYIELEETETKLNNERRKEYNTLVESLEKTTVKLDKFKHDKSTAHNNPAGLEKLKILMEEIEANIMQVKERQKLVYEDLMVDEKNLTSDIEKFNKKIESWSHLKTITKETRAHPKKEEEDDNSQQPEEVVLFERFLQAAGGHLGGWDDIDHQAFVRFQKQYKKKEQLLSKAIEDIPTQSEADIVQHIEWYEKYCVLRERKREAIRNWRKIKQNEKGNMYENEDEIEKEEAKRKKRKQLFEKERQERKQMLDEWKTRKEEEDETKRREEEMRKEENERLKFKQILEEKRRLETKIQIQEYKLQKQEEENILRKIEEEKQQQQQKQVSSLELERIRERNEIFLQQKSARKMSAKVAEEQKEERLRRLKEKVIVNVERDPNRLLRPTEGWKRRKDGNHNDITKNRITTGARTLPHRAIPTWRQGIT